MDDIEKLRDDCLEEFLRELHAGFYGETYDLNDTARRLACKKHLDSVWKFLEADLLKRIRKADQRDRSSVRPTIPKIPARRPSRPLRTKV